MAGIKCPFSYPGGKRLVAAEVWRRFGAVDNYVEPFFGGGAVLLGRPDWTPGMTETVNDLDSLVLNFWRAVKFAPDRLASAADYPVSHLDLHARHNWLAQQRDVIRRGLDGAPEWCDPKVAGWWVWGQSLRIGGGWASGRPDRSRPNLEGCGVFAGPGRWPPGAGAPPPRT